MDRTQLVWLKLLMIYHTVVFSVQAADQPPSVHENIQTEATSYGFGNTTISRSTVISTISDKEAVLITTVHNTSASLNTIAMTEKISSSLTLPTLSHFAQSMLPPANTDTNSPSDITIRFNSVVTATPTVSTFNQANDKDSNPRTSSITLKPTAQPSTAKQVNTTKALDSVPITQVSGGTHLRNSEKILTISFSSTLTFVVLAIVICTLHTYRKRRAQYSHHRLCDTSSETADIYTTPDDTLVISGGLYDAPKVYNPNMTVLENNELQAEYLPFGSRPGKFRLEILSGENEEGLSQIFDTF